MIKDFKINNKDYSIDVSDSPKFGYGADEIISNEVNDVTYNQDWYGDGYGTAHLFNDMEFNDLILGLTECVSNILKSFGVDVDDSFTLNKYHEYVTTDELHYKVVGKTRDLYPKDFSFPIMDIIKKLSHSVGFDLTDIEPITGDQWHTIIRINRPSSTDYNPPHKDFYGPWDKDGTIFKFINLWIPICGVTEKSSLPVVPKSHLLPENKILRTFEGGVVGGNKYRVTTIVEWDGKNDMIRPNVDYGDVLMFSPHLIHGLAINSGEETRVALEFRLFKK